MQADEHNISKSELSALISFLKGVSAETKMTYEQVLETYKALAQDKSNLILVSLRNELSTSESRITGELNDIASAIAKLG